MNQLEQLLNTLIQKGWNPRGEEEIKSCQIGESFYKRNFIGDTVGFYTDDRGTPQWLFTKSLREVCSKSSGLWQFVCENGMIKKEHKHERILDPIFGEGWADCKRQEHDGNYGYRLIESALCDEDKLEEFLLDNIKIEGKNE